MHSSETLPAAAVTSGPQLLLQLGRLIIRSRSASPAPPLPPATTPRDRLLHAKLLASKPSTSQQIQTQPKPEPEEQKPGVEAQLSDYVQTLWNDQIPVCIDVLLAADCPECRRAVSRGEELAVDRHAPRALLLERWTMQALHTKAPAGPAFMTSQWLLNAVRSQLHFSQLSAWRATITARDPAQRRRKLSRETCNIKKIEVNSCSPPAALPVAYSIRAAGDPYHAAAFPHPPTSHRFPITDIGNGVHLNVVLESLPRVDEIPTVKCTCPKRRASKEMPHTAHEELIGKLNDLNLGSRSSKFPTDLAINSNTGNGTRRLSIVTNAASTEYLYTTDDKDKKLLDDRMHTTCSENGKHKCNCDEESDGKDNNSTSSSINEPKKLDERRLKEIAKYKRRLRKESKIKKLCDSTSSEGDHQKAKETHTSIPILQAARFDRLRAIGCYRNQTYLTLPASRIESRSPFVEAVSIPPVEVKKTCTVGTQTEHIACQCGARVQMTCDSCTQNRMVRSEGNYDLAALDTKTNGARRKCEDAGNVLKKHKCDNNSSYLPCDNVIDNSSVSDVIKRPSLRRYFPIVDRLEKIVADRSQKDIEELHLKKDDSVFFVPKPEFKRQKTYPINEDYVFYEKCDYGTFDKCEGERVDPPVDQNGFKFPEPRKGQENQVPSPSEMDKFRWRFDSAASMVFHRKTGLPLTSSPAPLRRGNNCFDFDDSINGISGIKSALFHPISPVSPAPASPASPAPAPAPASPVTPPPPKKKDTTPKLKIGPSTGLLGSFEESALQGRLEPVATVAGFSAELGASGALCPPHRRLPVTVFFYAPGGTNAPYMGHINLGPSGYRVPRSGTVQVSLFNPHGTLVKMFVVLYDLTCMPPRARTFLRQRTLYLPARAHAQPPRAPTHQWLRYLIHLRFMTSKSGKLYLHTDIRIIVSRKADLDTATAHSLFRPISSESANANSNGDKRNDDTESTGESRSECERATSRPNRVFGGSSDHDSEVRKEVPEIGYENQNGVAYELRSFTYAPENPKYSPR